MAYSPAVISKVFRCLLTSVILMTVFACASAPRPNPALQSYVLDYDTPVDPSLQASLQSIDAELRARYGMTEEQTAIGVLDLDHLRVAMLRPDSIQYAASVAKIGILLAYFQLHPDAATHLDPQVRHELGLMIKISSNEMAAKYSRELGLREIQQVLNSYGFYDAAHGGGIWMGKHYGPGPERIGDPVANHSHAATVRQLLRYYLMLEQGKLVSPAASRTMREIFASPDIPHEDLKFTKALSGRHLHILRKSGTWEDWLHDTVDVTGPGRHYILVGLTHHPKGDEYLGDLAVAVDDLMIKAAQ